MTKENYKNLYDSLMIHRKSCPIVDLSQRDYEVHHIVPKSIGGSNQTENLVRLYMYEHFLAHKMLMHIYYGTEHEAKMKDAFWMMCYCGKDKKYNINKTSKQFQQDRILALQIDKHKLTGRKRINKDGKMKLVKLADLQRYLDDGWHMGGLPLTKEHRKNLSISGKGKKHKYTVTEKVKKHHQQLSKLYKGKILRKNKNTITITDGLHEKCVSLDFVIPKGWRRGRVNSVSKKINRNKAYFFRRTSS